MAGRWSSFSGLNIGIESLQEAVEGILSDYGDIVYQATEEGLTEAANILVENLKEKTPKKSGKFRKGWKVKKNYKLRRYVGNTATVLGKRNEEIALANIFEYSTTRGNPFIKRTYENSIPAMAQAVVDKIKGDV